MNCKYKRLIFSTFWQGRYTKLVKIKRLHLYVLVLLAILICVVLVFKNRAAAPYTPSVQTTKQTQSPTFNKKLYSIDDSNSIWVVVNKKRKLKDGYKPADLVVPDVALRSGSGSQEMHLRQSAANAMTTMFQAATKAGTPLRLASGYRSQQYQVGLFNGYVRSIGVKAAELSSARPGYSEHQTGLAADISPYNRSCEIAVCFANTAAGKWVAANAYKYGFIVRYPEGKTDITGYQFEPWHVRYVGTELSTEMHKQKIQTLEEFFGLPAAPSY